MARIALIKCSLSPDYILVTPPLGIMYLASVLRGKGHEVKLWDLRLKPERTDWIEEELRRFSPEIVGLSALTQESVSLHRIAGVARKIPGVSTVITGGPHPSYYSEIVLADPNIDYVVVGEGEETMGELVDFLTAGKNPGSVKGIIYRENGKAVRNESRPYIENLDQLSFPAWDLININAYQKVKRMGNLPKRRYMAVMTSRACPYGCTYCHKLFGKGFRPRSPESVISEMETLYRDHGIREFEIVDDIFNLDLPRVEEITRQIRERGWRIKLAFPNGLRGDRLNFSTLKNLKSAGTYFIALAVETASPRLQKLVGKNLDLDAVRRSAEDCRRLGITTLGFFMLGFPGETFEEARLTVEWAWSSRLDFASFFIVIPFGGTKLGEDFRSAGGFPGPDLSFKDFDYHRSYLNLSEAPDDKLFSLQRQAYRRFYLSRIPALLFRGSFRNVAWKDGIKHFFLRSLRKERGGK